MENQDYMLIDYHIKGKGSRQIRVPKKEGELILLRRELVKNHLSNYWRNEIKKIQEKHRPEQVEVL